MYKKQLRFNSQDADIISMALIDNEITGKLMSIEVERAWNTLDCLYGYLELSTSELMMIYNSLTRYATRYHFEEENVSECNRVAEYILFTVRGA